jgi:hypothetical protein
MPFAEVVFEERDPFWAWVELLACWGAFLVPALVAGFLVVRSLRNGGPEEE